MANQATATNDDLEQITRDSKQILEKVERQSAKFLDKSAEKVLTGENNNIIDSIARDLTSDPRRKEVVKKAVEEMVLGNELMTESETVDLVTKAIVEDGEKTAADEIAAKTAIEKSKKAEEENPEAFRQYRITKYVDDGLKQIRRENKNLTPEQEQLAKDQLNEIAGVMYSNGNLGNQGMKVSATFNSQSRGKVQNEFGKLKGFVGLITYKKKPSKVVQESLKRRDHLLSAGVIIPSNHTSRDFDQAVGLFNKDRKLLKRLDSIQGGGSFLVRLKMTFYNFSNGWRGGLIQPGERIGRQSVSDFTLNSMGVLLQNGGGGFGEILKGVVGSGVKSAFKNLAGDAALKLAGGALGPAGLAASKVLGFLKKFFGNAGSKLGIGARNGLGSAFDKSGSMLGKAAMGLGVLLGSIGLIGTATASTLVTGAVVGGTVGYVAYNQYSAGVMVSGLVVAKKVCDSSDMKYLNTAKKPWIPCSDMKQYTEQMRSQILQAGYQTRCAVIEAARYLVFDFPYHVPYHLGGYGEFDMGIDDDWCNGAMDCIGFVRWAYRQGGFAINKQTSTTYWEGGAFVGGVTTKPIGSLFKTNTLNFVPNNCGAIKERVQGGDIVRHKHGEGMHAAMVIGVDGTRLQIAQEGGFGGAGVNTCFIDICTGKGTGENPCGTFDRISLMDTFFEYYAEGGAIDGYPIKPNSDKIIEFPERD